jgi:hypothetical protein
MTSFRTGTVTEVVSVTQDGVQQLLVAVGEDVRRAVLYPRWTAPASVGDRVVLNTTAVELSLGTGGDDFVVWNAAVESYDAPSGGHIMKLRYTPAQSDVLAVEAQESPHHAVMAEATSLEGVPVVATSLHSQLVPALAAFRRRCPDATVVYVMTDGAALEAGYSNTLRRLRELGWLRGVVTTGHALGGDLEAVTLHTGLLAARHVLGAQLVVAGIGPGVVGTGTPFGTTALDLGTIALATSALGGRSVVCVRLSEADPRERHRGLSHHVVSALRWVAASAVPADAVVVVPSGPGAGGFAAKLAPWTVVEEDSGNVLEDLAAAAELGLDSSHMGRRPAEDTLFFRAAAAAGAYAARLVDPA